MLESELMKECILGSLKETREFAQKFAKEITPLKNTARIYGLSGDLGAGKTAFVRSIAQALGISSSVTSPTFVIQKKYSLRRRKFKTLIHIDAYRLKSGDELRRLSWEETRNNPENLVFIEWPDNVANALPEDMAKM
jgi:tRNA threonylcarbamoyladenosine biosynthesis protein TsaE